MDQPNIGPSGGQRRPDAASLHPDDMVDGPEDVSLDYLLNLRESKDDFGSDTFGVRLEPGAMFPTAIVEGVRLRSHHEACQRGLGIGRLQRTATRHGLRILCALSEWADVEQTHREIAHKALAGDRQAVRASEGVEYLRFEHAVSRKMRISVYQPVVAQIGRAAMIAGISVSAMAIAVLVLALNDLEGSGDFFAEDIQAVKRHLVRRATVLRALT